MNNGFVLIVDDHPLVARGFAEYLVTRCGFAVAHVATSADECLRRIETDGDPGLAVVDYWLPDGVALALLRQLAEQSGSARLLVVSGDDDMDIEQRVREAGAHGFLHKQASPETFAQAVSVLQMGGEWFQQQSNDLTPTSLLRFDLPVRAREVGLTERQRQVLVLMLRGLPNKRIAQQLAISEQTVKEHVTGILERMGARNRIDLITQLHGATR